MNNHEAKTLRKELSIAYAIDLLLHHNAPTSVKVAYKNPSTTKVAIEQDILKEMRANNGWNYRVTSHNVFFFSCAYLCENVDQETGEIYVSLVRHTPTTKEVINVARFFELNHSGVWHTNKYFDEMMSMDYPTN